MSDPESLARNAAQREASAVAVPPSPLAGMSRDPVVRMMTYVAIGLVILFLSALLGALVTGVGRRDVPPRTAAERELLITSGQVKAGATGDAWAPYINALIAAGDLRTARVTLDTARASVQSTLPVPALELAEARLELAHKRYAQAAKAADTAMTAFRSPKSTVTDSRYYESALVRAYALVGLRRWKEAVRMFDVFISKNATAADVLVDRGNAKVNMKDKAGAEKDFREALRFGPNNREAQAGLKKIGAGR